MTNHLVHCDSAYGHVATLANAVAEGSGQPSAKELAQARFQGKHATAIAAKLSR